MKRSAFIMAALGLVLTLSSFDSQTSQINALRNKWITCLEGKRLSESISLYTDDAVFYSPDGSTAAGKQQLTALFKQLMATFDSDIQMTSRNIDIDNELAYDSGEWHETLTNRATKKKITSTGSYLMVLKRRPDGSWQITRHMWTIKK